jgi:hypothetical protein
MQIEVSAKNSRNPRRWIDNEPAQAGFVFSTGGALTLLPVFDAPPAILHGKRDRVFPLQARKTSRKQAWIGETTCLSKKKLGLSNFKI